MGNSFVEDGVFPTWSLPTHLARNYVGPQPTARPSSGGGASTSSTSVDSQYLQSNVRFPVAPQGHVLDRQTIQRLYSLPPPDLRFDRLDKHHAMHVRSIDGLYYPKDLVRHVLRPEAGKRKRVLDLAATSSYLSGGGGGNWAIDMALEFPHVEITCIDKHPHPSKILPRNCRFQMRDFLQEMAYFHGQFDVVHARTIGNGVGALEYPNLIEEIGRCLKPGGLALLCDGDFQLLDHNLEPQEMALDDEQNEPPMHSWLARLFFEAYNTFKTAGSAMDAGIMLEKWFRDCEAFDRVEGAKVYTPIGPWKSSPNPQEHAKWQFNGTLMRENLIEFAHALGPVLLHEDPSQYSRPQMREWIRNAQHELETMSVRLHARYHYAWAVKRVGYVDPPWHEPYEPSEEEYQPPTYVYIDPDEEDVYASEEEIAEEEEEVESASAESHLSEPTGRYEPPLNRPHEDDCGKGDHDGEYSSEDEDSRRHSPRRRLSPEDDEDVTANRLGLDFNPPSAATPRSLPASQPQDDFINPYPHLKFKPTADWRPDPEAIVRARLDEMRVNASVGDVRVGGKRKAITPSARSSERGLYAPRPV